jgi:hypothetical protein
MVEWCLRRLGWCIAANGSSGAVRMVNANQFGRFVLRLIAMLTRRASVTRPGYVEAVSADSNPVRLSISPALTKVLASLRARLSTVDVTTPARESARPS